MTSPEAIVAFVDGVAKHFKPFRVVLFGSYAYGTPTPDSDVDILIMSQRRQNRHAQAVAIRQAISAAFPMDITVRTPREIERRIAQNDFFLAEIMAKGLVLYASDDARMGAQGRKRLRRRLASPAVA